jgi:hypothetical protein
MLKFLHLLYCELSLFMWNVTISSQWLIMLPVFPPNTRGTLERNLVYSSIIHLQSDWLQYIFIMGIIWTYVEFFWTKKLLSLPNNVWRLIVFAPFLLIIIIIIILILLLVLVILLSFRAPWTCPWQISGTTDRISWNLVEL